MKTIEKNVKEVIQEAKVTGIACDICGARCSNPSESNWGEIGYMAIYTELKKRVYIDGEEFGDEIDICPHCFDALIEAVKNNSLRELVLKIREKKNEN